MLYIILNVFKNPKAKEISGNLNSKRNVYIMVKMRKRIASIANGGFSGNEAYVNPSGLSGKYTGADGLKVWFTY